MIVRDAVVPVFDGRVRARIREYRRPIDRRDRSVFRLADAVAHREESVAASGRARPSFTDAFILPRRIVPVVPLSDGTEPPGSVAPEIFPPERNENTRNNRYVRPFTVAGWFAARLAYGD